MLDHNTAGFMIVRVVLPFLGLASLVGSTWPPSIDRRNLEVIGLTLFKDEVHNAEDKLGQAAVFHSPGSHFAERCYASTEKSGTELIIEDWTGTLVGFQFLRAAPSEIEKCTRTSVITP